MQVFEVVWSLLGEVATEVAEKRDIKSKEAQNRVWVSAAEGQRIKRANKEVVKGDVVTMLSH